MRGIDVRLCRRRAAITELSGRTGQVTCVEGSTDRRRRFDAAALPAEPSTGSRDLHRAHCEILIMSRDAEGAAVSARNGDAL